MEKPEKILVINNEFEAEIIGEILRDRGIPFMIRTFHDSAYDGLWEAKSGWGQLMADSQYKNEILKIYEEISGSVFDENKDLEENQ